MGNTALYSRKFYSDQAQDVFASAVEILPVLFDLFEIESIVDFGCGSGAWLRAAKSLKTVSATGIDGAWVRREMLVCPDMELVTADLESPITLPRSYDLALSVEVGEHLSKRRAVGFVRDICAAAPRVLFGAAVPGQGGTAHINEQWQSYWVGAFAAQGYRPIDVIRPRVLHNANVFPWYKNNTLLYVREDEYPQVLAKIIADDKYAFFCTDLVVPELFDSPGLRMSLRRASQLPGRIARQIKWRTRIGRL